MITYDGHDLATLFICGAPEISILNRTGTKVDAGAANSSHVVGMRWGDSTVSFQITALGDAFERRNRFSQLGAWLDVDGPRELVLPDTPDRFYMAIPEGTVQLKRHFGAESALLKFTLTDPVAYGEERTVTVPSGGSLTFEVGGTYPASPVVTATATPDLSTALWGLTVDGSAFIRVELDDEGIPVSIDCLNRTCTVSGSAALPTLASDWLTLAPGRHTLAMLGEGAAAVTYRERWL